MKYFSVTYDGELAYVEMTDLEGKSKTHVVAEDLGILLESLHDMYEEENTQKIAAMEVIKDMVTSAAEPSNYFGQN